MNSDQIVSRSISSVSVDGTAQFRISTGFVSESLAVLNSVSFVLAP